MTLPPWLRNTAAVAVPAATALATSPLRSAISAAAVAAMLVGLLAIAGPPATRWAAGIGAALAALAFDITWTRPYGSIRIHGRADAVTSLAVLVVGLALSERARRDRSSVPSRPARPLWRPRRAAAPADATAQLLTIGRVAEDLADGDAAGLVLLDIARGLVDLLKLRDCRFELAPLEPSTRPSLLRGGEVELHGRRWSPALIGFSSDGFDIPVVVSGTLQGRFVCTTRSRQKISRDRLTTAITLADEAALALRLSHEKDAG